MKKKSNWIQSLKQKLKPKFFYLFLSAVLLATGSWVLADIMTVTENPVPVFPTLIPDQGYVIQDNVNYKLYYAGNDFASINLAQSPDGVTWTPYVGNPIITDAQYHSTVHFYSEGFSGANIGTDPSAAAMYYRMWYQGLDGHSIGGWRYAESVDGIVWNNRTPVTQFGTPVFDGVHAGVNYGIADAVYTPGAANSGTDWSFRIYANVQWEDVPYGGKELVVMGFSANGYDWTGYDPTSVGYATPVFAGTLDGVSFDTDHIGWFKVVKNSDTDWNAFYSGGKNTTFQDLNGIGFASSTDGINWTRRKTLFTTADGVVWREHSVWMPSVIKTGVDSYRIWFLGSDNPNIGASDWIQWKLGGADLFKDIIVPTVTSTSPTTDAMNISTGQGVTATFSESMDPATITNLTFTLKKGVAPISGTVSYSGSTAKFIPDDLLDPNSVYTATITTGATDTAALPLPADYTWNFVTGWDYNNWTDGGLNYTAPAGDAYYPSVIYDSAGFGGGTPQYNMWYSDGSGGTYLVTSTDGTSWGARTTMVGIPNSHHVQVLYDAGCFGVLPCNPATTKYKIWLWDIGAPTIYSISSMAAAESADGINWINKAAVTQNPAAKLVQDPDLGVGWNRGTYGPVNVFYQPTATNTGTEPWDYSYVMYYNGTDGSHEDTGLAYSTDGLYWNAYTGNPVLSGTAIGGLEAWNCASASYGTVLRDSLGYHYFYSGRGEDDGFGGCAFPASFVGIGSAFSTDGKTWTKDTKYIFHISDGVPYRAGRVYTPAVINDGSGALRMYFTVKDAIGGPKKIAYATMTAPSALHIIKKVVNDNGGTSVASDFNLHVKQGGVDVGGSPSVGSGTPGTAYGLLAGAYTVSEAANASYSATISGDCDDSGNVSLAAGESKTCTITNDYISVAGHHYYYVTVVNQVTNNNGGTAVATDFPIFINGNQVQSGLGTQLASGIYTVTTTLPSNYTKTFSGACDANGQVNHGSQDDICTITFDDIAPPIVVPPVVPPVVPVEPPTTPPSGTGEEPGSGVNACAFDCRQIAYDLYIVNPDGSERHSYTNYVKTSSTAANTVLYKFEDSGRDFDYNDVWLKLYRPSCESLNFSVVVHEASWHHQVRLAVYYGGKLKKTLTVFTDDKSSLNQPAVNINLNDYQDICESVSENNNGAIMFEHIYFEGRQQKVPVGSAIPELKDSFVGDNSISSIRIIGNAVVRVFTEPFFKGNSQVFTNNRVDLRSDNIGQDTISSIQVAATFNDLPGRSAAPITLKKCASAITFQRFLHRGDVNSEVRELQTVLQCLGDFSASTTINGVFGPQTEAAVKLFQSLNGIDPLGWVGPATRAALNALK